MNDASAYQVKVSRVCEVPRADVSSSARALNYWRDVITKQLWFDDEKEHLIALLVDPHLNVQGFSLISIGSIHDTVAYPREIFRAAVACAAYGVVLLHNHPSCDATPSEADKNVTERVRACGELLGVQVFDHIIVGGNSSLYSFAENGALNVRKI